VSLLQDGGAVTRDSEQWFGIQMVTAALSKQMSGIQARID